MADTETPAHQPGTAVEQITAKAQKKRKHQEFLRQLHALPRDFRTRLNSSELRDVGKEFIKAQNKQLKNTDHRSYGLNPTDFEQVMGNLGFEDLPMMKRVFGIFDLNGDGEVDYHELVCCVDLLLRGHGEETLRFCFAMYDTDDSGYISEFELHNVLQMCGKSVMYDEFGIKKGYMGAMRKLYQTMDKNGDGHISYDEFVKGLNEHPILLKALLEAGSSGGDEEEVEE
jgi:Ca2+-binding EF-hand superfamily protein